MKKTQANQIKYKCTDSNNKYDLGENNYTVDEWKAIALGWFDANNCYALAHNLRALSKDDVLTFLRFTLDLKFEPISIDSSK